MLSVVPNKSARNKTLDVITLKKVSIDIRCDTIYTRTVIAHVAQNAIFERQKDYFYEITLVHYA